MSTTTPFAAALIAGGRSTRMGCDKGRLRDAAGVELWRRQLSLLRGLGAEEILISCREDQSHFAEAAAVTEQGAGCPRLVLDEWPEVGPLGGIVSCLRQLRRPCRRLLVLGVDLPWMRGEVLRFLLERADPESGAVFHNGRFFEPLAALVVREMEPEGVRRLGNGQLSLQPWINWAAEAGFLKVPSLPEEWRADFLNLNSPADLQGTFSQSDDSRRLEDILEPGSERTPTSPGL